VKLKPLLAISDAQAQAIVDRVAPGRQVLRLAELAAGEIGAVFEIVLADDSKTLLGLNFVVMTRLDGRDLLGLEPTLERSEVPAISAGMGRVLREIHRIAMDSFGYIGTDGVVTPFDSNRAYMLAQFERKLGGFDQLGERPTLARRMRASVARSAPLLDGCRRPIFCHYDFHTGNVLVARRDGALRLTGIVDLENAIAGDPLMDLAKIIAYSVRDDATKRTGLLAGYGPIDQPDWEATLQLYQFYGAIELWVVHGVQLRDGFGV
jgi:aminoglycoside phosphotransferase (APT) family kinase protein